VKISTECVLAMPSWLGDTFSAVDFDQSEWEIVYPHFVEEGLVDPFGRVNRKNV
jgi:hypothetical protein